MANLRTMGLPFFGHSAAKRAVRDFAELVGQVVNATVSHAPITLVEIRGGEPRWMVAHCPSGVTPQPFPLMNGSYMLLQQQLCIRRDGRHLATMEYAYWHQGSPNSDSWMTRWEFIREPPDGYPYPQAHIHVNARPAAYTGLKPYHDLHLPTGRRVTIEGVLEHLVREHNIGPISENWEQILFDAKDQFEEIQRRRVRIPR